MSYRSQYRVRFVTHTAQMTGSILPRLLLLLSLVLMPLVGQSETLRGTPLLRRYLPEDYNATPQHWSIATDSSGRLFVGNAEGVLRYDGETWNLIGLPGRQFAREVVTGADGEIYVGSYDSFGWLQTTLDGDVVYQELLTAVGLKGREREVGDVWQVIATEKGVYFRTEKVLHFLSYDRKQVKHWPLNENQRSFFVQDQQLYARINGLGFCKFIDGRFVLEPGGELFAKQRLPGMIARSGWRLLIGDNGFYRADAEGIKAMPDGAGTELAGTHPDAVVALEDGSFAVGTRYGEVFRFGPDYRLRERVSLGSFAIIALGADREGGLWAATEGDLVRMSLPSPWSFIGAAQGLGGTVFDYEWYDGALWLASTRGIVRMQGSPSGKLQTTETGWTNLEGFALVGTDSGLVIGHRNGILVLDPGASTPRELLGEPTGVGELLNSKFNPNRIYGLGEQSLFVIELVDGRWQIRTKLSLDGASASTLIETAAGELWFGDFRGGPQRWTLDQANNKLLNKEVFDSRQGLELDAASGSTLYIIDGQIHVVSGERGFRFVDGRFIPESGPPFTLVDRPDELVVEQTPLGTYAFTRRQLWFRPSGKEQWQPLHLGSQLAAGFNRLRYNRDGVIRLGTWSGLLQFNPSEKQPMPAPLVLGFDLVTAESPDGQELRHLPVTSGIRLAEIPNGYRLHFRYSLVSMDSGIQFRYRLNGSKTSDAWSNWTDRDLYVRAVTPGEYLLEVEARTRNGRTAAPASYRYVVLPNWYDRASVRLLGALLLLAVIGLLIQEFIRRRTERYIEVNRKLEARIGERTHELEAVNRKLAELATEDALTGVANRRALENGLQREWYRCLDQRRPLSVLMIDVDHFKRYNDAHGHLEGDVLLRTIAQHLSSLHDPKRELLSRYGGEEFALLLPGVHQDDAVRRAEKIRIAMQEHIGETTISIGVAGFVPTVQGESMNLLRRADAALYRAKRAGRNRVEADTEDAG
jgi:diguanylate cyclase (GGDEF)-like protein